MALKYEPLQDGEIRLLNLTYANEQVGGAQQVSGSNLALSFTTINITANTIVEFLALSYVWGDPVKTVPMSVSGGIINITCNLCAIFNCLASSPADERPTRLWIDALCINQSDFVERASQVSYMRQIYSRATSVCVFISTISEPFEIGLEFLRQAAANPESHYEPTMQPSITVRGGLNAHSETLRDSVIAFFAAPWWTRVWTVQEFVLSGRAIFHCGHSHIDSQTVATAFDSLRDHERGCCWAARRAADGNARGYLDVPSIPNGGLSMFNATLRLDQLLVMRKMDKHGLQGLLGSLTMFRMRKCSDPRDHIFGMLGLSPSSGGFNVAEVRVDYTTPIKQLFEDAAIIMIRHSGTLDVLSHVPSCSSLNGQLEGLPSWVPDWTALVEQSFHYIYTERASRLQLYNATGGMKPVWNWLNAGRVTSKALVLGRVSTTAPGYPTSTSPTFGQALLNRWHEMFGGAEESIHDFGQMISGCMASSNWLGDLDKHTRAYQAWYAWFTQGKPTISSGSVRTDVSHFDHIVQTVSLERHMFRTEDGQVGFGPEAKKGDVIVLMPGGRVPYVLREVQVESAADGNVVEYSLLGDAYVHGAMQGEKLVLPDKTTRVEWVEIALT